jgi:EpsD family peptidyl-prolyl cis-trans isomerase
MTKIRSVIVLLFIILAGCSSHAGKQASTNMAAEVNGVEITQGEVDFILKKSAPKDISAEDAKNLKRRILSDLVRTELLAQKARDLRLDKTSDFEMTRYLTMRQSLAGMAEAMFLAKVNRITPEEVKSVVENNPKYFRDRKQYVYDEVAFPGVNVELLNTLDQMVKNGASLEQLLDKLKTEKIEFRRTKQELTSERIQPALLSIFEKIKTNVPQVIRVENRFSIILMLDSVSPAPLQGDNALRAAANAMESRRRMEVMSKRMGELVNGATIKYFGEYATKDNGKQAMLPVPDQKKAAKQNSQKIILGSIISLSFISAMMMLASSMRILRGDLWLPTLLPSSKKQDQDSTLYDQQYQAYAIHKLYIVFMSFVVVIGLLYEVYILRYSLPIWGLLSAAVSGLAIGFFMTRLFAVNAVRNLSQGVYLFFVVLFTVPILASIMFIHR